VRERVELTLTVAMIVIISPGLTSPIDTIKECVSLVIEPLLVVTVITSINVGRESTTILSFVSIEPVFPTLIVKVKLSFTLACVGVTETDNDATGVNVPVFVGVRVTVVVGCVPVRVAVAVPVVVAVGVSV
jgi:hypothetical protein